MNCKTFEKQISDYLDQALIDSELTVFETHLKSCPRCAEKLDVFATLAREAAAFAKMPAPDTLWQRIEAELDAPTESLPARLLSGLGRFGTRLITSLKMPAPAWKLAGAVAVLLLGVFIGRYFFPTQSPVGVAPEAREPAVNAQLAERTNQFVEKSKVLLLGIVNADETEIRNSDWHMERNLAHNLFQEAAFLKEQLPESRSARLKMLIEELELILLEIAHIEARHDVEEIELIKSGIDRKGLLLKIYLHDLSENELALGDRNFKL